MSSSSRQQVDTEGYAKLRNLSCWVTDERLSIKRMLLCGDCTHTVSYYLFFAESMFTMLFLDGECALCRED